MAAHEARAAPARAGVAAAVAGGRIYIMGGHDGGAPLRTVEVLDAGESTASSASMWRALPPMLARRAYPTATVIGSMVYCIGGSADGRTLNTFEVFDTEKGAWDYWFTKPPMQTKRTMHGSAVIGSRLFVVGGFDGLRDLSTVECYDSESNTWQWKSPLPAGRSYLGLTASSQGLYAIGGQDRGSESGTRGHADVFYFDFWSERWVPRASLSEPRIGVAAAAVVGPDGQEQLYACGGSNGDGALSSVERLNAGDPQGVWSPAPPMGVARLGHALVVAGNKLYAIGGFDGRVPLDTFEVFDPATDSWSPLLPMGAAHEEMPEQAAATTRGPSSPKGGAA